MEIIERYNNPTKHVQAPYSTIHKNGEQYFIQVSEDPENPNWLEMGQLCVTCYSNQFTSDLFINSILLIYKSKNVQHGASSVENNNPIDFEGDTL